ncbi:hypothetical protein MSG44_28020, partial [Escherichia coli]|nr:hypothetical protein [Escherichia coli]
GLFHLSSGACSIYLALKASFIEAVCSSANQGKTVSLCVKQTVLTGACSICPLGLVPSIFWGLFHLSCTQGKLY